MWERLVTLDGEECYYRYQDQYSTCILDHNGRYADFTRSDDGEYWGYVSREDNRERAVVRLSMGHREVLWRIDGFANDQVVIMRQTPEEAVTVTRLVEELPMFVRVAKAVIDQYLEGELEVRQR